MAAAVHQSLFSGARIVLGALLVVPLAVGAWVQLLRPARGDVEDDLRGESQLPAQANAEWSLRSQAEESWLRLL